MPSLIIPKSALPDKISESWVSLLHTVEGDITVKWRKDPQWNLVILHVTDRTKKSIPLKEVLLRRDQMSFGGMDVRFDARENWTKWRAPLMHVMDALPHAVDLHIEL
jgi:hypothetical protein